MGKRHLIIVFLLLYVAFSMRLVGAQEPVQAYPLRIVVSTTSDWTRLTLFNVSFIRLNYSVVSGVNASQLRCSIFFNAISISKGKQDASNVTIVIDALAQVEDRNLSLLIEKGDLGETVLKIYGVEDGELRLGEVLTNSGSVQGDPRNPRRFNLTGVFRGFKAVETSIPGRKIVEPVLLAFYYPWYGNPQGGSGVWSHWEGVGYREIGSSTHYPLFGPYDSQDENLIRVHIRLAKAFGVDGFVCSWWGIDSFEDIALRKIVRVANEENFNVTIYYESVRDISKEQIVNELSYVLRRYSGAPSFLKINGSPIIFIYSVSAYDRDPSFWGSVMEEVWFETGINATFIADTFDTSYLRVFDGLHTYNPIWVEDFNSTYVGEAKSVRLFGKIWVATVSPGYDDRKIRVPGSYVDRRDGAYYEETWRGALASDPDMILICTWNEWHEGSEIKPSREYGFRYLGLTGGFAEFFKETEIEASPNPLISLEGTTVDSNILLNIINSGSGDAAAVSVIVSHEEIAVKQVSNLIRLPINESSTCFFIPLLESEQDVSISLPFGSNEAKVIVLTYFSLNGDAFTIRKEIFSAASHGDQSFKMIFIVFLILGFISILLLFLRKRFPAK